MTPRLFRFAFGLWAAIAAAVVATYGRSAADDFFITFRYAANFANGNGLVFNPGERVLGLTEPLQGLTLGALAAIAPNGEPWLGALLTAAGILGLAWLLGREALAAGERLRAFTVGSMLVTAPLVWDTRGAGVIPGLALLAVAARFDRWPWVSGLTAALAVGFRPELALGAAAILLLRLKEGSAWRWLTVSAVSSAATVGAGAAAAAAYYGSPIPITLVAKRGFADWLPESLASGAQFWSAATPLAARDWGPTWWLFGAVALTGCFIALVRGLFTERVLVLQGLALLPAYPLLGVPFFSWYGLPLWVAAILGFARAATSLSSAMAEHVDAGVARRRLASAALPTLLLLLAGPPAFLLVKALHRPFQPEPYRSYRIAGEWLRTTSAPEASIAALEVGTLAFFADRRVVDLLGLVSPEALKQVQARDPLATLRSEPTTYFVITSELEGLTGPLDEISWFTERYALVRTLEMSTGAQLRIFRYRGT